MAWPLPALCAWALAWGLHLLLSATLAPVWLAPALATALGVVLGVFGTTAWRRVFIAAGFPLSLVATSAAALPGWTWLLPLAALVAIYPLNAWRDAPLFPTPAGALQGLARLAPLGPDARVLDAGCGLGAGLIELRSEYPSARLVGLEWSWPLRLLCALRCRFASVRRGDIWTADWAAHDMVYLFQRPESMARALEKARRELRPDAWLASLEFPIAGVRPHAVLRRPDAKPVWLYRPGSKVSP
jgi:SAM-dependent methyltransferase